jgi:hypothetical protein
MIIHNESDLRLPGIELWTVNRAIRSRFMDGAGPFRGDTAHLPLLFIDGLTNDF